MSTLVEFGASDLPSALIYAARYNHVQAVRWIASPERALAETILGDQLKAAQEAASITAATETEWLLVSIRYERERMERRATSGTCFET